MDNLFSNFSPFGHEEAHGRYQDIYHTEEIHPHHKASFTHEAVAGAAGFAAMKAYESHLRATGQEVSHPVMKEILAGIAAAEVDKLIESKGMDWIDRHKARELAKKQAHELADQRYRGQTGYQYAMTQGGYKEEYNYDGGLPWGARGHGGYAGYGQPASGGYPAGGYPQYYPGDPREQGYYPPPPREQGYSPPREQEGYEHHHHGHHHDHHHRG